jgi:hypothetical protein
MRRQLVIEGGIASALAEPPPALRVLPRQRSRAWRCRRTPWVPLRPDDVLEALDEIPRPAVVLARSAGVDPGAACLAPIGRLLGHDTLVLPDAPDEAAWVAGVACEIDVEDDASYVRILHVVCCGPSIAASFPRRRWGPTGISVPALRPATLARWASCSWQACRWCVGGGLPGSPCRCCGAEVDREAG